MSARTIETKAIISAEDRTGPAFAAVVQHMAKMEDAARHAKIKLAETNADKHLAGGDRARVEHLERQRTVNRDIAVQTRQRHAEERRARSEEAGHMRQVRHHMASVEHHSRRQIVAAAAGGFAAHETSHLMHRSLEVYREFDKERRYGKAVMGITDEQQKPLIDQAIHGGATSKFNDIQWLEAQRELAARGLTLDQVRAITPLAAKLGQAMDKTLPEASRLLEGGMFGFGKDTSTYDKALANARRTADLQVKASKISGMDANDVRLGYKVGATPFKMAGLSEEQLLAFLAVGKKANMGGDEMGVAARALIANMLKPTAGARTSMMAAGIDYSKYQNQGPKPMDVEGFAKSIAQSYGVELSAELKKSLQGIFNDKAIVGDAAKFMPAVMKELSEQLGGDDAKSKKSIAGEARRYRDASMGGVDTQRLLDDLIVALARIPSLANAIWGAKQGARIKTGIGDPGTYNNKLDELQNHSQGYSDRISEERMAGFDGAVSRFEGAIMNLESALPRAFDKDGKGGALTDITSKVGEFVQSLAEAPPQLQRLGVEAGLAAAAFAGLKGLDAVMGGFGLKSAAAELTSAAKELMGAAGKQAIGGSAGAGAAAAAAGAGGGKSRVGRVLKSIPLVGSVVIAGIEAKGAYDDLNRRHDEEFGIPEHPNKSLLEPAKPHKANMPMLRGNRIFEGTPPQTHPLASLAAPVPVRLIGSLPASINPQHVSALPPNSPLTPGRPFAAPAPLDLSHLHLPPPPPQKVDVAIQQPPPAKVDVTVTASSQLLAIEQSVKSALLQIRAVVAKQAADTGPGGLGPTHTGQ